jgi:anti-sigma B factor antagonist
MTTLVRTSEGTRIVDVTGEIDLSSSSALRRLLFETLQGAERLAINLAGAKYIDSSGIATLIEVQKEAQRAQKEMVLFALSTPARDVFALTHVTKVFRILETEAEALKP